MPKEHYGEEKDKPAEVEWETVNRASALWTRPRSEVKDEEYQEFYKHVAHDFDNPLSWSHNKVEGKLEYTSLLYVPGRAPFDLYHREAPKGPQALRSARVHHGSGRRVPAAVPAFHQGCGGLQ